MYLSKKRYQCVFCPSIFKSYNGLLVHALSHKTEKLFKCRFCSKAFTKRERLEFHERVSSGMATPQDMCSSSPQETSSEERQQFQCPDARLRTSF
ncbi:hypothetical protein V5799_007419 [Amblyomma americanum]|uniref:C2H2-type domain-containing protein n=1 Tax=Amblyomma americanum TaxID=6943 RepID=A0AAQ4FGY4_AMBAM